MSKAVPAPEPVSKIRLEKSTILIAAVGFEDRATAIFRLLESAGDGNVVAITYNPGTNREDFDRFYSAAREAGVPASRVSTVDYLAFEPHAFDEHLQIRISALRARRAVLDISAMSKMAILLCLDVCRELCLDVTIHYAEAQEYGPTYTEYDRARHHKALKQPSVQIYTGVRGVLRVARFSSVAMQGQPTAAIAFMSFNEELIQALLDSVYPTRLFLINGRPPVLSWREEATAWIHSHLVSEWPPDDNPIDSQGLPLRRTSTLDYRETVEVLLDLYWRLNLDHRILLAPTGSKMQTIACFLTVAIHPDIHVEYPMPHGFLRLYSKGIGPSWVIRFSHLGKFIDRLAAEERNEHLRIATKAERGPAS